MRLLTLATLLLLFCVPTLGQQESFESMLECARQGKAWCQNEVGGIYSLGEGVKRNHRKAFYWFTKAAEQGNALGACNLGLRYGLGWGVRRNPALAMKWLFIGTAVDALRCHYGDYYAVVKPRERHLQEGHKLATAWLCAHPDLKDNFGERPWMGRDWPDTLTVSKPNNTKNK